MHVTEYVVGFAFDRYGRVALIRKNRPEWQAGLWNGIGGHVENNEDPDNAMRREFCEETGVDVDEWEKFVVMDFPTARVNFYRSSIEVETMDSIGTVTDEMVLALSSTAAVRWDVVPNLKWLIPLARHNAEEYEVIHINARSGEDDDS